MFTAVLIVAIMLGIQNHNDRVLSARVEQSESELRVVDAKIADIKEHRFGTMGEYFDAYARVEPLLTDYDQKLQQYTNLCNTAQQREQKRRLINNPSLHNRYNPDTWRDTWEIIELVRQVNQVTKKEASVIRDMSSRLEQERVQFWHEEFMPLATQQHALREGLLLVERRGFPERAIQ